MINGAICIIGSVLLLLYLLKSTPYNRKLNASQRALEYVPWSSHCYPFRLLSIVLTMHKYLQQELLTCWRPLIATSL